MNIIYISNVTVASCFFHHRIIESLRLEGTSRGHLAQSHYSKQDDLEQIAQLCVELALFFLQGLRLYSLSRQVLTVFKHLTALSSLVKRAI